MLLIGTWIVASWATKYSIFGGKRFTPELRYRLIWVAGLPNQVVKLLVAFKGRFHINATPDVYSHILPNSDGGRVNGCVLVAYINSAGVNVVSIVNTSNCLERVLFSRSDQSRLIEYTDVLPGSDKYIKPAISSGNRIWSPHLSVNGLLVYLVPWNDLVAIDLKTGLEKWRVKGAFHHSIESDSEGNFWVCAAVEPNLLKTRHLRRKHSNDSFEDQALVKISDQGQILKILSIADLIIDCGIEYLLYGASNPDLNLDPIHLNQISTVNHNSGRFQKGDVLVSLRNLSTIMLINPELGLVKWHKTGPWMNQHSVGYHGDSSVYMLDNHSFADGEPWLSDEWSSKGLIHDTVSGETKEIKALNEALGHIKIPIAGKIQFVSPDAWMLEDDLRGTIFIVKNDKVVFKWANLYKQGGVGITSWSRYLNWGQIPKSLVDGF